MEKLSMQEILKAAVEKRASDVHIRAGEPVKARINKELVPLADKPLTPEQSMQLCYSVMTTEDKKKFEEHHTVDFSFGIKGIGRFRGNVFMQKNTVAGVFRSIREIPIGLEEIDLPIQAKKLADLEQGLVLVTGPTGSGKSTTLAAYIEHINQKYRKHILTLEDPIEYVFTPKKCTISQREIGKDVNTFAEGLKYALRQDPDVVMVGEMRDPESIEAALTIAETGHLVFSTLHTNSAVETVTRIVSVFPANKQNHIRSLLSFVLKGVICQRLLPRADGKGVVLAAEFLLVTPAVARLIRDGKTEQLPTAMQSGRAQTGMQTMVQSIEALFKRKLISKEVYQHYMHAVNSR